MAARLALLALLLIAPSAHAAGWALDSSFGRGGTAQLSRGEDYGSLTDVLPLRRGALALEYGHSAYRVDGRGRLLPEAPAPGFGALAPGALLGIDVQPTGRPYPDTYLVRGLLAPLDADGRQAGEPVLFGPPGARWWMPSELLRRREGGWLAAVRTEPRGDGQDRAELYALTRAGEPDADFGDGGRVALLAGDANFAVAQDRRGRTLVARLHQTGRGKRERMRLSVVRIKRDGTLDPAYRRQSGLELPRYTHFGGAQVDRSGRLLVTTLANRPHVLRLTSTGAVDRRFGSGGSTRLSLRYTLDITPPVLVRGRIAVGYSSFYFGRGKVALLDRGGRVRQTLGTPRTTAYPATSIADLARDRRGRLLAAGARWNGDDPFYLREDYGTPFPTLWRFRAR